MAAVRDGDRLCEACGWRAVRKGAIQYLIRVVIAGAGVALSLWGLADYTLARAHDGKWAIAGALMLLPVVGVLEAIWTLVVMCAWGGARLWVGLTIAGLVGVGSAIAGLLILIRVEQVATGSGG